MMGDLKPGDRVGVIAGGGILPLNVVQSLVAAGHQPFVIIIDGERDMQAGLKEQPNALVPIEKFARILPILRTNRVTHVVMAGAVTRRPKWSEIEWSWPLLKLLAATVPALARGDDGLLRAIVAQFEKAGFRIVGPNEFVPDLLAREGVMTRTKPNDAAQADISAGLAAARAIGALDIGQGAVSVGGRVIALEGIEGTEALLERVKDLRAHPRLAGRSGGVLVKCAKPGQELRADLPGIGTRTVDVAHAAGLKGIAVEAGRTFIVDFDSAVRRADDLGMFIVGFPAGAGQ